MPTENATMFDQVAEVIERLRPFYYVTERLYISRCRRWHRKITITWCV